MTTTAPSGGLFCEHKKLRMSCAICKPPPPPPAPKPAKAAKSPASSASGADDEAKPQRATGPGKPLLPSRAKKGKAPTRAEAENAEAWWTKK